MSDFEAYLLQEVNAGIPSLTREAMAYSLIHDDLPAMDNDDLRRGNDFPPWVFTNSPAVYS